MTYEILTYDAIDRTEWGRLVRESETGTWFQSPEAYMLFASMPDLFMPFVVGVASLQLPPEGRRDKPTSDIVLRTTTGSPIEQSSSPVKGRGEDSFASVWGSHTADSTQYNLLKANAIVNRKTPTEAESVMWDLLKGNNLGLHFRRQHIILDYIVDFICLDKGLVVELDGGYHLEPEQKEYDEQRTAHLQKLGYTELRFTNEELLTNPDVVIARIKSVASSLPSLQGRGGDRPVLRGVCVGYITVEKSAIKQFFTRRAIINGGPCFADDATDEEVETLLEAVKEKASLQLSPVGKRDAAQEPSHLGCFKGRLCSLLSGRDGVGSPIYIETRNFNDYSKWRGAFEKAGFEYMRHLNFHIDCTDKEAMWERLSEVRRRQVKKAISNGVEIKSEGISEAEIREWYQILKDLYAKKVKTPLFPLEFFLSFYRKDIGKYLLVKYRGKVIGGMICPIMDGRTIYEWYICGLDNEYREQYPSVMATWAAMEYANEHGLARFDVMGAGVPGVPYGVRDFKAEFGGELVEQGRFLCVCKPWLYRLGTFVVKLMKRRKQK